METATQPQRITLVARPETQPESDWNHERLRAQNVTFLSSISSVTFALKTGIEKMGLDIERVIADRAGSAEDYLHLLAAVPDAFTGDIVLIREDGSGFLSASARGGDRVLYAMSSRDVRFYLEMNDLVTGRVALAKTA